MNRILERESNLSNSKKISSNEKYKNSVDCRLALLTHMLNMKNIIINQYDILGYSSSLDFLCEKKNILNKFELLTIKGRKIDCEQRFIENVGLKYVDNKAVENDDVFDEDIMNKVLSGIPVILSVDRYYLEFLNIKRSHFGWHAVMINGVNKDNKSVEVIDALSSDIKVVDFSILKKAMFSEESYITPQGKWYYVEDYDKFKLLSNDNFINSLRKQSQYAIEKNGMIEQMNQLLKCLEMFVDKRMNNGKFEILLKCQVMHLISVFKEQESTSTLYRSHYFDFIYNNCKKYNMNDLFLQIENEIKDDIQIWKLIGNIDLKKNSIDIAMEMIEYLKKIKKLENKIFVNILLYVEKLQCN